jgi:hypothetical protein
MTTPAIRYTCSIDGSHPHSSGDGTPKRSTCRYCGGGLSVHTGLWGAFEWTAASRYPIDDARRTFSRRLDADRFADATTDLVVRWIPGDSQ